MIINCNIYDKDRTYIPKEVPPPLFISLLPDERAYEIPGATKYIFTDYCRLYPSYGNGRKKIPPIYTKDKYYGVIEGYIIEFDNGETREISIPKLIKRVFFPDAKDKIIVNDRISWCETVNNYQPEASYQSIFFADYKKKHIADFTRKWEVKNLKVLDYNRYVKYLYARIKGHKFRFRKDESIKFIRWEPTRPVKEQLQSHYSHMKGRCTNEIEKKSKPGYADATIDDKWLNSSYEFFKDFLGKVYPYPSSLELDKDIWCLGRSHHYGPNTTMVLPSYINIIFTSGEQRTALGYRIFERTEKSGKSKFVIDFRPLKRLGDRRRSRSIVYCDYQSALIAGRKLKADSIRRIVRYEQKQKKKNPNQQMPDIYLEKLLETADLIEAGRYKMFEPSNEVKKRYGVVET